MEERIEQSGPGDIYRFLNHLQLLDFEVGPDDHARVVGLLLRLQRDNATPLDWHKLRRCLGPVVCKSEDDQTRFDVVFSHWYGTPCLEQEVKTPVPDRPEEAPQVEHPKGEEAPDDAGDRSFSATWILAGAAALAAIILILAVIYSGRVDGGTKPVQDNGKETPNPTTSPPPTHYAPPEWDSRYWTPLAAVSWFALAGWLAFRWFGLQAALDRGDVSVLGAAQINVLATKVKATSSDIRKAYQRLRIAAFLETRDIDVERSVSATATSGGYPIAIWARRQSVPEYLFLIDKRSRHDHQARLFEELIESVRQVAGSVDVYSFDADPSVCYLQPNDTAGTLIYSDRAISLAAIYGRCQGHRLVVFGDGAGFFETATGALKTGLRVLQGWERRVLVTPHVAARWSWREWLLDTQEGWAVIPATDYGLSLLPAILTGEAPESGRLHHANVASYSQWAVLEGQGQLWIGNSSPSQNEVMRLLDALWAELGLEGFRWFAACAVFPLLRWNITMHLGSVLRDDRGRSLNDDATRVATLASLPWFRTGRMPRWLREAAIRAISKAERASIQSEVTSLLEVGRRVDVYEPHMRSGSYIPVENTPTSVDARSEIEDGLTVRFMLARYRESSFESHRTLRRHY